MNGLFALQQAVYTALTGDATLMAMVEGVYDRVPSGVAFPYVVIGEADARDWSSVTTGGLDVRMEVSAFSREGGRKEALAIVARIHTLLHDGSFSITGHTLVQCRMEDSDIRLLGDGLTYRGAMTFRVLCEVV